MIGLKTWSYPTQNRSDDQAKINALLKPGPTLPETGLMIKLKTWSYPTKTGLMIRLNELIGSGPTHSKTGLMIRLNALKFVVLLSLKHV